MTNEVQDKKTGRFAVNLDDSQVLWIISEMSKEPSWMLEVLRDDLVRKHKIDPRTAVGWIMYAQKVELKMRDGLSVEEARKAI